MESLDLQQPAESRAFAKPVNLWERLLGRLGNGSFAASMNAWPYLYYRLSGAPQPWALHRGVRHR
jgi:hypothetical protein